MLMLQQFPGMFTIYSFIMLYYMKLIAVPRSGQIGVRLIKNIKMYLFISKILIYLF